MEGSLLSFLKAEWKMSDTGSAHWVSSFTFCLYYLINPYTLLNFIPKIIVVFRTDLHKMKINTELCCKRYDFLTKLSLSELLSWMTIFKSIHMAFYVNTSWACALFRNNKQHVVLGQKRKCQRVQESGLWRIQRERWIEVKYLPNGTNAGYM